MDVARLSVINLHLLLLLLLLLRWPLPPRTTTTTATTTRTATDAHTPFPAYLTLAKSLSQAARGHTMVKQGRKPRRVGEVITKKVKNRMEHLGLPVMFLIAVTSYLISMDMLGPRDIHCVEFFAGVKSFTAAFREKQLTVSNYELLDDDVHQNLLTDPGLICALALVLRTRCGGLNHWATVCSSWVTINRGACVENLTSCACL